VLRCGLFFKYAVDCGTYFSGIGDDCDAEITHYAHFFLCRIGFATYDGTSMSHRSALGGRNASDVGYCGLGVGQGGQVFGSFDFHSTSDLTDDDDGLGLVIFHKELYSFLDRCARHGISTYADTGALSQSHLGHLVYSFVSQGARAGDDTDDTGGVDKSGHDAEFCHSGGDDTGAIGTYEATVLVGDKTFDAYHVLHGYALRDADDELDARVGSFADGIGCKSRRYEDDGCVGLSGLRLPPHSCHRPASARYENYPLSPLSPVQ